MGQIFNELTKSALGAALLNALGLKEGKLERFGETLTPIIDLWGQPEWQLLRGEIPYARVVFPPAVAARFSSAEFVNATDDTLAVMGIILCGGSADMVVDSGGAIAANPVTTRGVCMDTRTKQLGAVSRCTITSGDVGAGVTLPQWRATAAQQLPFRFVIAPGKKLFIVSTVANTAVTYEFIWTERRVTTELLQ